MDIEKQGIDYIAEDDIWEVDSCPDLYHGEDKVTPYEKNDYLNCSFPGLNQEDIDPVDKRV